MNVISLELISLVSAASCFFSGFAYGRAYKLFILIEQQHPGFNEYMRPWCKRIRGLMSRLDRKSRS